MVNIIKQEIEVEEALKKKLEFICSFCNTNCEIKKGSIRTIERTNLSYVELHRIIIKDLEEFILKCLKIHFNHNKKMT